MMQNEQNDNYVFYFCSLLIQLLIVGILSLVVGIYTFFYGFKKMREVMLVADTPISKTISIGFVKIHGKVLAKETIKAPFSKIDCVYYKYNVKEYKKISNMDQEYRQTLIQIVLFIHQQSLAGVIFGQEKNISHST